MTKRCYKCVFDKPLEDFPLNRTRADGHGSMCKACKKTYNGTYYVATKQRHNPARAQRRTRVKAAAREFVYDYLRRHPCVDCGETDIVVLDFDHQGDKLDEISVLINKGVGLERIRLEIEKCEVVCANDHRRRTARAFGWRRAMAA